MGRGKIEIKRIENATNRQVTFSKRRGGLLKKANELAVLCDARVGVVIFSSTGKMFEYCSPTCSLREVVEQYQTVTTSHFEEINHDQQIFVEMTQMRNEMDKLETGIRRYTGDDLSFLTLADINDLEQQLEFSVTKVRARKHQLLDQQLDNLRRKEHILEDQNSFLCRMINENQQAVGADVKLAEMAPVLSMLTPAAAAFGHPSATYYGEESSSTALQLTSPQLHGDAAVGGFRLQPTQPNLHDPACSSLQAGGHGLKLWVSKKYPKMTTSQRTMMKETKGKYFSDLSSESARDLFEKFVKEWNKGKLPTQYYEGISSGPRSAHRFLFLSSYTEWSIQKGGASCSASLYLPLMLVLFLAFAERSWR